MTTTARPLAESIDVETPELVVLSYTPAGVGSRAAAAFIDYLLCLLTMIAMFVGLAVFSLRVLPGQAGARFGGAGAGWVLAIMGLVQFAVLWLYYVLFEAFMDGQTPGKRLMRLRVVRDGGLSVTFAASAVRNLVRAIDMQPFVFYLAGAVSIVVTRAGKRLGDLAAGTIVVREALVAAPMPVPAAPSDAFAEDSRILHAALTDAEFDVLDRYMQRRVDLGGERRATFAAQLAQTFAAALPEGAAPDAEARLAELHDTERGARARGLAARHDTGAARERHAIVAASAIRWAGFADLVARAQQRGLAALGEDGVREFVEQYREVTADLARLRTATRGRDAQEVFYLNRLVSTAHNLLYRRRSLSATRVARYLFADVPRQIRASVMPIAISATLLFTPMVVAAVAIVRAPATAEQLLPPQMFDRAEQGVKAARTGAGYIEDPGLLRPAFASRILTNNVQVSFIAFAGGITAGLLTVFVLVTNGVSIGAAFGLYLSKGIGSLLFTFVASHGVLELSAIVIAGAAGLLLAAAMLVPGNRTRRRALVENGRRAIDLVAGTTMLLICAGVLEGFVSPNASIAADTKYMISGVTALLLTLYVSLGRQRSVPPDDSMSIDGPATTLPAT